MMITFNDNEKKLKDDLNRDIALPAVVHERINTAYRMIEEHTVKQKKKTRNPYHWMKTGAKVAGGLAAGRTHTVFPHGTDDESCGHARGRDMGQTPRGARRDRPGRANLAHRGLCLARLAVGREC